MIYCRCNNKIRQKRRVYSKNKLSYHPVDGMTLISAAPWAEVLMLHAVGGRNNVSLVAFSILFVSSASLEGLILCPSSPPPPPSAAGYGLGPG